VFLTNAHAAPKVRVLANRYKDKNFEQEQQVWAKNRSGWQMPGSWQMIYIGLKQTSEPVERGS
jgi:hypothetical protein